MSLNANAMNDRLETARALREKGRFADAEVLLSALLTEHDRAAVWQEAGLLSDERGDGDRAIARLTRAAQLSRREDRPAALVALARAQMHAGRFARAARTWWQLTRLDETSIQAWAGLVVTALAAGRHHAARRAIKPLLLLGTRWQRREHLADHWRHAAAMVARDEDVSQDRPTDSPLGVLLEQATETFTAHAQRFTRRADTFYHLGICREAMGDLDHAARAAAQALTINPNYAAAQRLAQRAA